MPWIILETYEVTHEQAASLSNIIQTKPNSSVVDDKKEGPGVCLSLFFLFL